MEHVLRPEDTGILRIQAEHQPDAELVQTLLAVRILRVDVLRQELVIQDAHDLARLDADLHLLLDVGVRVIHEEGQTMELLLKAGQADNLRLRRRTLHVVNLEGRKVAGDNPPGGH